MRKSHLLYLSFCVSAALAPSSAFTQAPSRAITAAEQAEGIRLYAGTGFVSDDRPGRIMMGREKDAYEAELSARAAQWVQSIQKAKINGIQLDAFGEISVVAGQNTLAQRQFAARLASKNLSAGDRAYTLALATTTFGKNPKDTARVRIANEYLAMLDALPDSLVIYKYRAHVARGMSYYEADESKNGIYHLMHAYSLLPVVPFERIYVNSVVDLFDPFLPLANMLSGQPNGRAAIDSLGKWVLKQMEPSPALIQKNPFVVSRAQFTQEAFKRLLATAAYLGRESPPITGHAWWNTNTPAETSPDDSAARILRLNDGKIHVLELGHRGCKACMIALPKINKLRKEWSKHVEAWYVTYGTGTWAGDSVTRTREAELLHDFYVKEMNIGLPIAAWFGERKPDIDGGTYPAPHPTYRAFGNIATPLIVITDGQGRVRYLTEGYFEDQVRRVLRLLESELASRTS